MSLLFIFSTSEITLLLLFWSASHDQGLLLWFWSHFLFKQSCFTYYINNILLTPISTPYIIYISQNTTDHSTNVQLFCTVNHTPYCYLGCFYILNYSVPHPLLHHSLASAECSLPVPHFKLIVELLHKLLYCHIT